MRWFDIRTPSLAARRSTLLLVLLISTWGLTGCLVRHRAQISNAAVPQAPVLKTATLQELLDKIKTQQEGIQTLNATATIEPTIKSAAKGEIVSYRDVRTFILLRQPAFIRMIGLYPLVQNTAFDMASDGDNFRLYIPIKNRFIIGKGQQTEEHRSASALDNLRPQYILDALLLRGPQPGKEEAVLEVSSESGNFYIIHILRRIRGKPPLLARNIWLERRDLAVVRLQMFDDKGEEVTDVLYSDYVMASGIPYPREILVERPKDLYSLRLLISTLVLNQPIDDEKFHLEQPPGTELTNLDQQPAPKNGGNGG